MDDNPGDIRSNSKVYAFKFKILNWFKLNSFERP